MLGLINFIEENKNGFFDKIKYFLFPTVQKRIKQIDEMGLELILYDVVLPLKYQKGKEKALAKLKRELLHDEIYEFLSEKGEKCNYLTENGFRRIDCREYLMKKTSLALINIIKYVRLTPKDINLVIVDRNFEGYTTTILEELIKTSKSISLISPHYEKYRGFIKELYNEYGTAVIVTDELEALKWANIVIILNSGEQIIEKINKNTLVFCLDENKIVNNNLNELLINAFCFNLTYELMEVCPKGIKPWELAAGIYLRIGMGNKFNKINDYFGLNGQISLKAIKDNMKRLDIV